MGIIIESLNNIHNSIILIFPYKIKFVVIHVVDHGRNQNFWITKTHALGFACNEINFIPYFMHGFKMIEVIFCFFFWPPGIFHKAVNKHFSSRHQVYHSAIVVTNQGNSFYTTDSDGIRNPKLTIAEICSSGSDNVSEVFRDVQVFTIIHTHSYQQLG